MPKRTPRPTMADIVSATQLSPQTSRSKRVPPGIHGGRLIDRDGLAYELVQDGLPPAHAVQHVAAGAQVAFDECGCGGTCGFTWLSPEESIKLAAALPDLQTRKGHTGSLSLWRSESGHHILLAQGPVSWA